MIDTIKLELPQFMYTIVNHDLFTPPTRQMFEVGPWSKGSLLFSKQNPTAKDRKNRIYKPKLSVARRPFKHLGYQNTLYVEVSLPKLLFGNNFDELKNSDYEQVKVALYESLLSMGVQVRRSRLDQSQVSLIHYGKNIILDDFSTPYSYIKELKQVDFSKIYDVNQTDYRNGGMSYKLHSNLFEFAFYDKLNELERSKLSEKRSVDMDDYCQLGLFDLIEARKKETKPFEVLRVEMRLNNRKKIRETLKKYKLDNNVCFEYLFDQDIAQALLLGYYKKITANYIPTSDNTNLYEVFYHLKSANQRLKDSKILELSSAQLLINQNGVREFRNMINNKTWYRLKKSLQKIGKIKPNNPLNKVRQKLDEFETVQLVDFPQLMINNDKYEIN